jgi:hypothetical protein
MAMYGTVLLPHLGNVHQSRFVICCIVLSILHHVHTVMRVWHGRQHSEDVPTTQHEPIKHPEARYGALANNLIDPRTRTVLALEGSCCSVTLEARATEQAMVTFLLVTLMVHVISPIFLCVAVAVQVGIVVRV